MEVSALRRLLSTAVAVATAVAWLAPVPAATELPDLGNAAAGVLSDAQEVRLGQRFMLQARYQFNFIEDPELEDYLNTLGRTLVAHSDAPNRSFRFMLINDPVLNAFAAPGGHISVYSGLFMKTKTESELAAVLGHEIAHVTQHHLQRMVSRAKQQTLPATAAMIAAILLGGQLGAAALATTNAALADDQLRYSRDFEREADAIGIRTLGESGFDANAMAGFFGALEEQSRLLEGNVPEFLRSHPLSINRIAEAQSRANRYLDPPPAASSDFEHARAKLRAMAGGSAARVAAQFADNLAMERYVSEAAERYGYALALARNAQYDSAQQEIARLIESHPDEPRYASARSQILMAAGHYDEAIALLAASTERFPEYRPLWYYYSDALLRTGQADAAKPVLRARIRAEPDNPHLYRDARPCIGRIRRRGRRTPGYGRVPLSALRPRRGDRTARGRPPARRRQLLSSGEHRCASR